MELFQRRTKTEIENKFGMSSEDKIKNSDWKERQDETEVSRRVVKNRNINVKGGENQGEMEK